MQKDKNTFKCTYGYYMHNWHHVHKGHFDDLIFRKFVNLDTSHTYNLFNKQINQQIKIEVAYKREEKELFLLLLQIYYYKIKYLKTDNTIGF